MRHLRGCVSETIAENCLSKPVFAFANANKWPAMAKTRFMTTPCFRLRCFIGWVSAAIRQTHFARLLKIFGTNKKFQS